MNPIPLLVRASQLYLKHLFHPHPTPWSQCFQSSAAALPPTIIRTQNSIKKAFAECCRVSSRSPRRALRTEDILSPTSWVSSNQRTGTNFNKRPTYAYQFCYRYYILNLHHGPKSRQSKISQELRGVTRFEFVINYVLIVPKAKEVAISESSRKLIMDSYPQCDQLEIPTVFPSRQCSRTSHTQESFCSAALSRFRPLVHLPLHLDPGPQWKHGR